MNQEWATAVEVNTVYGTMRADVLWPTEAVPHFRVMVGGIILSPLYPSRDSAIEAASAVLERIGEGYLLVEGEGGEDYPGQVLPTGWDAADHKALYE